jgi:hypothetical protein
VLAEDPGSREDPNNFLNSTRSRHETPLILYLGAEVMPKCPNGVQRRSLQHRRIPFCQHLCIASLPRCHSGESTLRHLHLHCRRRGPPAVATPQQVRLELPGYEVPLAQSQKAPPPEMHVVVSRDDAPMVVAHCEVPTQQWANGQFSCRR